MHCALVFTCSYMLLPGQFLYVLTCLEQKSGRSISGIFFKHRTSNRAGISPPARPFSHFKPGFHKRTWYVLISLICEKGRAGGLSPALLEVLFKND